LPLDSSTDEENDHPLIADVMCCWNINRPSDIDLVTLSDLHSTAC